jgi:hypothetical protein
MKKRARFPRAIDPTRVGKYPAVCYAGGGFVWDAVLEYRVWCHPERGAPDKEEGNDYYHAFMSYPDALRFSKKLSGAERPLALILQKEYIAEPVPGRYVHVKKKRITEWPVGFLSRPRRTKNTIPDFLSSSAPRNRLAILRGLAKKRA